MFSQNNQSSTLFIYPCQTRDYSLFVNLTFWLIHVKAELSVHKGFLSNHDGCHSYLEDNRSGLVSAIPTEIKKKTGFPC